MSLFYRPFAGILKSYPDFLHSGLPKKQARQGQASVISPDKILPDRFQLSPGTSNTDVKPKSREIIEQALSANEDPMFALLRAKGYLSNRLPDQPNIFVWPARMSTEEGLRISDKAFKLIEKIRATMPPPAPEVRSSRRSRQIVANALKKDENPVTSLLAQKGYLLPNSGKPGFHWSSSMPLAVRVRAQEKAEKLVKRFAQESVNAPSKRPVSSQIPDGFYRNEKNLNQLMEALKEVDAILKPLVEETKPRFDLSKK